MTQTPGPRLPGLGAPLNPRFAPRVTAQGLQKQLDTAIELHKTGRREEAERAYLAILQLVPQQPDALNLLGVLAAEAGKLDQAVALITQAAGIRPKDPVIINNLGNTLFKARRYEEAVVYFERAAALNPDFPEAWLNLGKTLRFVDRRDESLAAYRRYAELKPGTPGSRAGISRVLQDQGDFKGAEEAAREVIASFPEHAAGYVALANVRKFKPEDPELEKIESLIAAAADKSKERPGLYFAAAKICDDIKRFDEAFYYYDQANRLAEKGYDHDELLKKRRDAAATFTRAFYEKRKDFGVPTRRPIFIVGMPRSGTTLTEQILAAHRDVYGAGELETMPKLARSLHEFTPGEDKYPLAAGKLTKPGVEWVARKYLRELDFRADRSTPRVTDKMPHNFEHVGLIALAFPNAKIIHCKRDAMDTSLSCWMQNFNDAHDYARDLFNLGRYYREYEKLMQHWRANVPTEILEVQYEDTVADQEAQTRRILEFCELEWDPNCLDFFNVSRPVMTASSWQVRQPVYTSSKQRWRNYERWLEPLKAGLEGRPSPA